MEGSQPHDATIDAWLARLGDASPRRIVSAFERTFGAMWHRAQRPLGDVTLAAIVDRVILGAASTAPLLATLSVDLNGLHCDELYARAATAALPDVRAAVRAFLLEFLSVLGELTAHVLTPAMHAEIAKASETADLDIEPHDADRLTPDEGLDA